MIVILNNIKYQAIKLVKINFKINRSFKNTNVYYLYVHNLSKLWKSRKDNGVFSLLRYCSGTLFDCESYKNSYSKFT